MVRECEVTLSGSVNSRDQKRRAEDVVERLPGAEDVNNNLCVEKMAERTGLEPATPGVTGRYSNQLNYRSAL
jgi:hypothetical protein